MSMRLEAKIKAGEFIILGELEPPKGADFSSLLKNANLVKGRVDAIVVPEMANAVMKASSLSGCAFLQAHGFETVLQACCRDRNRLALQADILGAAALGIPSIMAVPGEEITYGDHHQARAVNDLDLLAFLGMLRTLAGGKDMAGIELQGSPPAMLVGTTFNAGATGGALDVELGELQKKIDLGVRFVITTPVFEPDRLKAVVKRIDAAKVAVIPTVLLLKSAGMARYIDRNIRHISIPADLIQSIQKAGDKAHQCTKIAGDLVSAFKGMGLAGTLVSTIGWEDKLPQVLDLAKL